MISGDWGKFIGRLLAAKTARSYLTKEACLELLRKQNYKCALTGVDLTCILEKGFVRKTNVSIDRIDPKSGYVIHNIQLVCAAVNKFRVDTPIDEFIDWCKKVNDYAVQKQK